MGLGDSFSKDDRRDSFQRQFHAGRVCRLFCHFTKPPKEKLLVVGCVNPKPLFFVINSEITTFIQNKQHLLDRQVPIAANDHDFLTHDSYIECTTAIDNFELDEIERQIIANIDWLKGTINDETKGAVIQAVTAARTLTLRHKQWILAEMS